MEKKKKKMPSLSKEMTLQGSGEASFRVLYYGESGAAVPFKWESQPGTPKHELFSNSSLPPLTPPPSYTTKKSGEHESVWRARKKNRNVNRSKLSAIVLLTNFPKLARRNSHVSSVSNSSSSSSAYSDSPMCSSTPRNPGRSIGSCLEDDLEEETVMSKGGPMSALVCFGCGDRSPMSSMKNTLFSVVACRRSTRSVDYIV